MTDLSKNLGVLGDVEVKVSAVLGKTEMTIGQLLEIEEGTVLELDRKIGEDIDIYVNDNLVAKGEVVVVDNQLGIVLTEILE